jgi:hypothetical protein
LDQIGLLRATSFEQLLTRVAELTTEAAAAYEFPWPEG